MTSTDIAVRGNFDVAVIAPLMSFAEQIAKTDFVPGPMKNRPEAVLACMMTGQEIGIAPMQSLRQIDVIDGRPALRAELMRALVFERGHEIWVGEGAEFTTTRVVWYGRRKGSSNVIRVEWNADMVKQARLDGKDNHKKNPRQMLSARASSELCRVLFPDVIAGMGYTREELEDGLGDTDEALEVIDGEVVEPKQVTRSATTRKRQARARTAQPPAAVSAAPAPDLPGEEPITVESSFVNGPRDAQPPAEPVQTEEQKIRSVQIVKLAKALGVDHHPIVSAVTNGVTNSARMLEADEAVEVMNTIRAIDDGRATCEDRGDGRMVIFWREDGGVNNPTAARVEAVAQESPPLPDEPSEVATPSQAASSVSADTGNVGPETLDEHGQETYDEEEDPEDWDADTWRSFLKDNNFRVVALIKEAARLTPQGETPPGSLQSISGSGVATALRDFVKANAS